MFFIEQIKRQFILTLSAKNGEGSAAAIDQHYEQNQAANDNTAPAPNLSVIEGGLSNDQQGPQTAEALAFQELNEELDGIDNDSTLVSTYTNILGNFLVRVRNGEIEGLSEEDSDFQRLLKLYEHKFEELKDMRNRGQEIEHVIAHSMSQLNEAVDRGATGEDIDDAIDKAYEEGIEEKERQEELEKLETERDSYSGILREKVRELPHGMELSDHTKTAIAELQSVISTEIKGDTTEEEIIFLQGLNERVLQSFTLINEEIQAEVNQFNIDKQNIIYTAEQIPEMLEGMESEKAAFRKIFFEDILGEQDEGKPLSEYREHEKVQAFESETPEGHQFGYSLEAIIDAYSEINIEENLDFQEHGEALFGAIEGYKRLNRSLIIIERDMTELESGETLGEKRLETTHEGYKNMVLNEDGSLTSIGESIATGDESVDPQSSRLPNFEDLRMDQIKLLKAAGADLRVLFLTTPNGTQFDTNISTGGGIIEEASYIVNFSGNRELASEMDFAFMDFSGETIEVDGETLTFQQDGVQGAGYYTASNEVYPMQDGSIITIGNRRETNSHVNEAVSRAVNERLDNFASASAQERAAVQAIMSGNPTGNFDVSKLPGGLAGAFLALILNMFDDRNFEYNPDTKLWEEKPEGVDQSAGYDSQGRPLTNADVIGAYRGSMELGSLSARFESSSQGPVAYNPDDNGHGPSYGTYQMNSEVGVHRSFIQKHGIADGRAGWMAAVQQYGPEEFQRMEHEHIKENNYDPMIRRINVPNKENFSIAMQNVIWSIGVQHGPGHGGLLEIINTSGVVPGDRESEAVLINALYDKRERIWPAGVASRYTPERADALAMLNTVASSEIPNIYEQGLRPVPTGTKSHPISRSERGTPECSKTARLNLTDFGLTSPYRGGSARESFNMYPADRITAFPPSPGSDAIVADLYLDASSENAEYGHRVAAFKQDGAWFVFDPYYADDMIRAGYSIPDRNSRIPAEDYIKYMGETQGREFWGAAYFK